MRFKFTLRSLGSYAKVNFIKICLWFTCVVPVFSSPWTSHETTGFAEVVPPFHSKIKKVVYSSTKDYLCIEQSLKIVLGLNLLYISLKISKNVFIHALLHVYDKNYIIYRGSLASFNYLLYNVYCLMDVPFVDELYYQSDGHIWD